MRYHEFVDVTEHIESILRALPTSPGVYLMKGSQGEILYVGKAVNLRSRVRSYFRNDRQHAPKVRALVRQIHDLETIGTDTEVEALVLENVLIKRHQPHYNILLKDQKTYPWLKLTVQEAFPRLVVARRKVPDGARYFGPYPDTGSMYRAIGLVRSLFPLRQRATPQFRDRPCLNHAIGRCPAPCQGLVDRATYRQTVEQVEAFLEGRHGDLLTLLEGRMRAAAEALDFEAAARSRDAIAALVKLQEEQKLVGDLTGEQDLVGFATDATTVVFQVFEVRQGTVTGRRSYELPRPDDEDPALLSQLLSRYYAEQDRPVREILVPFLPDEAPLLETWLGERRGARVELHVPRRGGKHTLLEWAERNARSTLDQARTRALSALETGSERGLEELARTLGLDETPARIEGFDIAHVQGSDTVASMVVFEDGLPARHAYRKFKIRTVEGVDDFRSMHEVVTRRFRHLLEPDPDGRWARPDLVLIDGGKGQLGMAVDALHALGLDLPLFGLAKRFEEIYLPGRPDPVRLPAGSAALRLVQRVRDEAHRFANTFHGQQRGQRMTRSWLDEVPGIGPARRRDLLQAFGSVEAMRGKNVQDLVEKGGLPRKLAETLYHLLQAQERS